MSTNFYFLEAGDESYQDANHIGLSAAGLFVFHAFPEKGLTTFEAWQKFLQAAGRTIVDEYNRPRTAAEFTHLVQITKNGAASAGYLNSPQLPATEKITLEIRRYRDENGHMFANYNFC